MARYILGVHSGHDSSACLIKDDSILYAIEKERLTRKKHDSGDPTECIEYLLETSEILPRDISLVVRNNWFDSNELNDDYYLKFPNVLINKNHHLFHAYATSMLVPEGMNALIWVVDGRGCRPQDCGFADDSSNLFEAESVYCTFNGEIKLLEKIFAKYRSKAFKWGSHIDTIGYAYSAVSKTIFADSNAAGKIMALAAFGREDENVPDVLSSNDSLINEEWLHFIDSLPSPLAWRTTVAKNLSFSIQNALEVYAQKRIARLVEKYACKNICISGGVALNCKNNGLLANSNNVENLFIFPASGDNGLSVGAAVWAVRTIFKDYSPLGWRYDLGKIYVPYVHSQNDIEKAVDLLISGKVVGIFENGSEFGPRALCNRSLLTIATISAIKVKLNRNIKQRESFRPFGGIILEKNLSRVTNEKIPSDLMLSAIHVRKNILQQYPALPHKDNTVRMQIIKNKNSSAYKILSLYEEKTGNFLLINTSFNSKDEPIVETPTEAEICAKKIGIDAFLFNGKLINVSKIKLKK